MAVFLERGRGETISGVCSVIGLAAPPSLTITPPQPPNNLKTMLSGITQLLKIVSRVVAKLTVTPYMLAAVLRPMNWR